MNRTFSVHWIQFDHLTSSTTWGRRSLRWMLAAVAGVVLYLGAWGGVAQGAMLDELADSDQERILTGEAVSFYAYPAGAHSPWPKATVYQRIEASPEEAVAVAFDFARHGEFFPGVLQSKVSRYIEKQVVQVDYTVGLSAWTWGWGQDHYTLEFVLEAGRLDQSFTLSWYLIRPGQVIEYLQGSVRVEPLAQGGSLMVYEQMVLPYSSYGLAVSNPLSVAVVRSFLTASAQGLARQIKREQVLQSCRLIQQVRVLRKALE
jgi:hypothetical protein